MVNQIANKSGLTFTNEKETTKDTFAPIDILDYIYAVLHSRTYREKYKEFLKTDFPNIWGATYTHHNKFTKDATEWSGRNFLNDVKNNIHHYKGIHPIRINIEAQQYLNSCIVDNKDNYDWQLQQAETLLK